jgi:hypothetical protein
MNGGIDDVAVARAAAVGPSRGELRALGGRVRARARPQQRASLKKASRQRL